MVDWSEFQKMDSEAWMAKADLDLRGKKQASDLLYNIEDDFFISPFLTQNEVVTSLVTPSNTSAGVWIDATNIKDANNKAMHLLNFGPTYLLIKINSEFTSFEELFYGIHLEMVAVVLMASRKLPELELLLKSYLDKYYHNKTTNINLISSSDNLIRSNITFKNRLKLFGGISKNSAKDKITTVLIALKKDFLAQIAELRAMRAIWINNGNDPSSLFIISIVDDQDISNIEVHPLIQINYLLMSAYLGMSNVATVKEVTNDVELMRLSLNIQHILTEESNFGYVNDPMSGSYIIESLTQQMINIAL
jgi:hypothetical protein